jgi:hypothetical protein
MGSSLNDRADFSEDGQSTVKCPETFEKWGKCLMVSRSPDHLTPYSHIGNSP